MLILQKQFLPHKKPEKAIVIFAPYHFCDIDNWGQTQSFNYLTTGDMLEVYAQALAEGETEVLGDHFFTDLFLLILRRVICCDRLCDLVLLG